MGAISLASVMLAVHALRLVISHAIRRFRRIEEWRIHRAGADAVDRDAACAKFLGRCASKVLDGRLGSCVRRIQARECGKQRCHDGDDLAVVVEATTSLLDEEVGGLAVDREH